jgi:hypothetical protein
VAFEFATAQFELSLTLCAAVRAFSKQEKKTATSCLPYDVLNCWLEKQ